MSAVPLPILILESEPEEVPAIPETLEEPMAEELLDLEELDFEGLRGMPVPHVEDQLAVPVPTQLPSEELADLTPPAGFFPPESFQSLSLVPMAEPIVIPEPAAFSEDDLDMALVDLPDLGPLDDDSLEAARLSTIAATEETTQAEVIPAEEEKLELPPALESTLEPMVIPPPPEAPGETFDWSDTSESMLSTAQDLAPTPPLVPIEASAELPEEEAELIEEPMVEFDIAPRANTWGEPLEATQTADLNLASYTSSFMGTEAPTPPPVSEDFAHLFEPPAPAPESIQEPVPAAAAVIAPPASPAPEVSSPTGEAPVLSESSKALLDALLADSALMDALSKALVARLGDKVLREIAWEVIPELAERIPVR